MFDSPDPGVVQAIQCLFFVFFVMSTVYARFFWVRRCSKGVRFPFSTEIPLLEFVVLLQDHSFFVSGGPLPPPPPDHSWVGTPPPKALQKIHHPPPSGGLEAALVQVVQPAARDELHRRDADEPLRPRGQLQPSGQPRPPRPPRANPTPPHRESKTVT